MKNIKVINDDIIIRSNKNFFKINSETREFISKEVFKKDGNGRDFVVVDGFIYCKDMNELYKLSIDNFEIIHKWSISDNISVIGFDNKNIYISLNNGSISLINRKTEEYKNILVDNYSFIDMIVNDKYIYLANSNCELLIIEKSDFRVIKRMKFAQNIKSIFLDGDELYVALFNLSIKVINLDSFQLLIEKNDCHQKLFKIVGKINNLLITTSLFNPETRIWRLPDFKLIKTFKFASKNMIIQDDYLFYDDIFGVKYLKISNIDFNIPLENDEIALRLI